MEIRREVSLFTVYLDSSVCNYMYIVSRKKTWHLIFVHIFINYGLILKIFSLAHLADNLQ